jgi:antitoxin ParD1/3/4
MTISLTPELEQFIQKKVESGLYPSASEVVHEALRLLEERDLLRQTHPDELRKEIAIGIEQMERGEYTTYEEGSLNTLIDRVTTEGRKILARKGEASQG